MFAPTQYIYKDWLHRLLMFAVNVQRVTLHSVNVGSPVIPFEIMNVNSVAETSQITNVNPAAVTSQIVAFSFGIVTSEIVHFNSAKR